MPTSEIPTLQEIVIALGGERPATTEVPLLNQILTQIIANGSSSGGAVSSVFGRTGAVVAANGDYTPAQVGATTVGDAFFQLTNPSAVTFPRINADNSVTALSAANFLTAIGAAGLGANTFTAAQTVTFGIAAATQANGLSLVNSTAATSGNQAWSPSLILTGNQFASGASRAVQFQLTCVPVEQNFDHATLRFSTKHGVDAAVTFLNLRNYNGSPYIEINGNITIGSTGANGATLLQYNGSSFAYLINGVSIFARDLHLSWCDATDVSGTNDTGLKRGSAGVMQATNGGAGYGALDASAYKVSGAAGVTAGPFTVITSITVVGGIVTALTGS